MRDWRNRIRNVFKKVNRKNESRNLILKELNNEKLNKACKNGMNERKNEFIFHRIKIMRELRDKMKG